ncbi:calcium-binding protein, partial [Thioclava sp. BHET1]
MLEMEKVMAKGDGVVQGTSGDDRIDNHYVDADGNMIDHGDHTVNGSWTNDDTVTAGDGNDTVYADNGNDVVYGGNGNDDLHGGSGDDTLYGEAGNDTLTGDSGNNALDGGAGDDTFIGGAGADTFSGGSGQDNIDYSNSAEGVNVNLSTGEMSGGDAENDSINYGIDGVVGSSHDDHLVGFDQQGTSANDTYTNELYG